MITHSKSENGSDRRSSADMVTGFAVLGCLTAGAVGILKALQMDSGLDVLLCLIGSAVAFGVILHFAFRRS